MTGMRPVTVGDGRMMAWRGAAIIMELTDRYYFILFYCVLSVDNNKPVDNLWTKCVFLYFLLTRNLIITSYYY